MASELDQSAQTGLLIHMEEAAKTPSEFMRSWLVFRRSDAGTASWEANEWVVGAEVYWSQEEPAKLLEAIELLSNAPMTKEEQVHFGTGPVEALLAFWFEKYAGTVFDLAVSSENVRNALRSVIPEEQFEVEFDRLLHSLE